MRSIIHITATQNIMALAIFDLDNTLIKGDSDHLWGEFLIEKGVVDADTYHARNNQFYEDYKAGILDIMAYQRFSLQPLTQHDLSTLNEWHQEFMQSRIAPIYLSKAQAVVDQHRENGDTLLIITATNSFVTRPIGKLYGIHHLIGTDPIIKEGRFTGEVDGVPSFQDGKVTRLKAWLSQHQMSLEGSYFYSDSRNDIPLLEAVETPIVVDADPYLSEYAEQKGWQAISFRD